MPNKNKSLWHILPCSLKITSPTQIPGSFVSKSLKLPSLAQQLVFPHPVFSQTNLTARKEATLRWWVVQSSLQRQRWCLIGKFNPPELLQHLPRLPAASQGKRTVKLLSNTKKTEETFPPGITHWAGVFKRKKQNTKTTSKPKMFRQPLYLVKNVPLMIPDSRI